MARIYLGFNCNCFTNRYDEPEEWTRLCAEMGIRHVMFNVDLIDPYWPWSLQKRLCDRTRNACEKHGVTIRCGFAGQHGHQHYLGHPVRACRQEAEKFFRRCIRQAAYLGGASFGTCFAILTCRCNTEPALRREVLDDAIAAYHRLAEYGADLGLKALAYEATSVPRETCATFAENDEILARCSGMVIPMRICLDLGHRNMAGLPEERDHLAWIRRYGRRCDVIDCQQTDTQASNHWPFTAVNNARGVIRGDEVVRVIQESGAGDILLAFELRTAAFYPQEEGFLDTLRQSVEYWRQWVKE